MEAAMDKAEQKMRENKENLDQGEARRTVGEENAKKVADMETSLDAVARNLRESTEKYDIPLPITKKKQTKEVSQAKLITYDC